MTTGREVSDAGSDMQTALGSGRRMTTSISGVHPLGSERAEKVSKEAREEKEKTLPSRSQVVEQFSRFRHLVPPVGEHDTVCTDLGSDECKSQSILSFAPVKAAPTESHCKRDFEPVPMYVGEAIADEGPKARRKVSLEETHRATLNAVPERAKNVQQEVIGRRWDRNSPFRPEPQQSPLTDC